MPMRPRSSNLAQRVKHALLSHRMVRPGNVLGIAVSGGADSVALLRLLHKLQDEIGVRLAVLHYQHGLRGEESAADERFVAELANRLGIDFLRDGTYAAAWAAEHRANLEEAGRRLRTAFFGRMAAEGRVTCVATAHTMDDQAETLLAHIIRGTGLAGLGGIHPVSGTVVRPLLDVRRAELRAWLESIGQHWREDSTNADQKRTRARLRSTLLPQLERDFQPGLAEHLSRLAGLARDDEALGEALAEARFREVAQPGPGRVTWKASDLVAPLPLAVQAPEGAQAALARRMVRLSVSTVLGHRRGLTAEHVEAVLHLARGHESGHRIELPHGVVALRNFGEIAFTAGNLSGRKERLSKGVEGAYSIPVELPQRGSVEVIVPAIRRRLCLKVVDCTEGARQTVLQDGALDAGALRPPFLLRNWHPGDVYRPQGRRQARKLKEWLREARVPAGERALWPVLESGGTLVWVRGLPPAEGAAAGPASCSLLFIREESIQEA